MTVLYAHVCSVSEGSRLTEGTRLRILVLVILALSQALLCYGSSAYASVLHAMREWQAEPLRLIRAALATAAPLREHTVDALDSLCTAWQQLLSAAVEQSAELCDRQPLALSLRPEPCTAAAAVYSDDDDDDMLEDEPAAATAAAGAQPPCSLAGVPFVLRAGGVSLLLTSEA
eukprot:8212-Heterococcus_DN1.PRE.1